MPTTSTKRFRPDRTTVRLGAVALEAREAVDNGRERNLSVLTRKALRLYLHPRQQAFDPRPLTKALTALRLDLARTGSNLNQLAHAFNTDSRMAFRDPLAISHDQLREDFKKVMSKIGDLERHLHQEWPDQ